MSLLRRGGGEHAAFAFKDELKGFCVLGVVLCYVLAYLTQNGEVSGLVADFA